MSENLHPPPHLRTSSREELVREWQRNSLSERERAGVESAIWHQISEEERVLERTNNGSFPSGTGRLRMGTHLAKLLKTYSHGIERRQLLYNLGPKADPLWRRIDDGMTLSTAVRIVREARKGKLSIEAMLQQYDKRPQRKKTSRLRTREERRKVHKQSTGKQSHTIEGKAFWNSIRDLVARFIDENLGGIDSFVADKLRREFEVELNTLLVDFSDRMSRAKGRAKVNELYSITESKISRRRVLDACATIVMAPPKPGRPIDVDALKKRFRARVRVTHPDVTGHEETRAAFEAVVEAYELLKKYNESLQNEGEGHASGKEQVDG